MIFAQYDSTHSMYIYQDIELDIATGTSLPLFTSSYKDTTSPAVPNDKIPMDDINRFCCEQIEMNNRFYNMTHGLGHANKARVHANKARVFQNLLTTLAEFFIRNDRK